MRAVDIRGGTNRADVPASAFAMPAGMKMRYDLPAPELRHTVTGYAIYAAEPHPPLFNWFLPAPPMICVLLDAGPVSVKVRKHAFGPLAAVSLYGPTSCAFRAETTGGVQIGIGLSALGWVKLLPHAANLYKDHVIALADVVGDAVAADMLTRLSELDDETMIAPTVDDLLAPLFERQAPHEEIIRQFTQLMLLDGVIEIADVAERLGLSATAIRRIATHAFGMPPKFLLRRARFLRSFIAMSRSGEPMSYGAIDSSYFDASHFLRDANTFLGTTPRRFMAGETTFLKASLRARAATLGPATHALHS